MTVTADTITGQTVTTRNVGDLLRAGTIFTLTEAIDARRPAGTHYLSQGLSDSGFCVAFYNTATGRDDQMMVDSDRLLRTVRVLGQLTDTGDTGDSGRCACSRRETE